MKIINLSRGQGKTTRLLYASEFQGTPILCSTHASKDYLLSKAREFGLDIPDPIVVSEIANNHLRGGKMQNKDLLVDEAPQVLQALLSSLGMKGEVKAITLTENNDYC